MGSLDCRYLRSGLVLYYELRVLFAQPVLTRHQHAVGEPHWRLRRPSKLRFQTPTLGFSGWQLLVWRHHRAEWRIKLRYLTEEFTPRLDCFYSSERASVRKA